MKCGSIVNLATSAFMKPVLKSNQHLSCSFSLFCSKVFMFLLAFKQFISVSYKMCRMDIAENHAIGFAYYTYKTLISFKIYVVAYQY